ncbi:PilN domain-containing protein [Vibrio hangzhouensis]|uniref:Type IV pilus assembly protein PilN n=1 Tax=Vibrio hangzhouensis TaxID=462991 RepID=A0A1H6BT86_9VIBR|nr:PilN domain-containing protein [Vibrio hangzhouensis]SEG63873.1 type IV pilus assembly protein PilN [Vibrio hangzhouensis]
MVCANLLPWREGQRRRHKHRFLVLLMLALVIAGGITAILTWYAQQQAHLQWQRTQYLKQTISEYRQQIAELSDITKAHDRLEARLEHVRTLQAQRSKTTAMMNLLPSLMPPGVYIDKIRMEGTRFKLSGVSDSTARLATMLKHFENSPALEQVEMHSIVHGQLRFGRSYQAFELSFQVVVSQLLELEPQPQQGEH